MTDEEAIFAYIDGGLEGEDQARIEAAIDADTALQAMVAENRALASRLHGAFSTILEAQGPQVLSVTAATDPDIISLARERARRERRCSPWDMSHWAAMAATLVAGVIGGLAFSGGHGGPVTERGGQLVASGRREHALNAQLASTQSANAAVRIGLTFRNHRGAICRTFAADAAEGVACRDGGTWLLRGLLGRENASTGDHRMAASSGTAELVGSLIAGEALDQARERDAPAADGAPSNKP